MPPRIESTQSSRGPSQQFSNDAVVELAANLVSLSTNLAETLRATPRPGTPTAPVALRREDVERIVRRTEQHFAPEIERLRAENMELQERVRHLTSADGTAVDELRSLLQSEKRQRLQCEEQSQRMIEEHSKQVLHLENRIRKLERQVQDSQGVSNRGTPRSSRNPARFDDEVDRPTLGSPLRAATPRGPPTPKARSDRQRSDAGAEALSTSAVNEFLQSIGRELDAINALEASRGQALSAL